MYCKLISSKVGEDTMYDVVFFEHGEWSHPEFILSSFNAEGLAQQIHECLAEIPEKEEK